MPHKTVLFYINGHPVHLWRAHPHADYSTDIAFVLAKVGGFSPPLTGSTSKRLTPVGTSEATIQMGDIINA